MSQGRRRSTGGTPARAGSEDAAEHALEEVERKWGSRYPGIIQKWYNAWEHVTPFLQFPPEIRRVIYTTNTIESINSQLRKVTRNRGHFPNDDALIKVLYLAVRNMEAKGRRGGTIQGEECSESGPSAVPGRAVRQRPDDRRGD